MNSTNISNVDNVGNNVNIAGRVERLPFTRSMWIWATLISLGMFWDSFQLFSASSIALHFFAVIHAVAFGAYLSAAFFGGTFTGAIFFAILGDRLGRKTTFATTLTVMGFGDLIALLSVNGAMLFTGMTIAGFGAGVQIPLNSTYTQEISSTSRRAKTNAYNLLIGFSGGTIGVFAAALLVPIKAIIPGYKLVLLIMVIGAFSSLLIRLKLPESPRWLERKGKLKEADAIMSYMESKVKKDFGRDLPQPVMIPEKKEKRSLEQVLFGKYYRKRTSGAWIIEFAQGFGFYGLVALVPSYFYILGFSIFKSILFTGIIALSYPVGVAFSYFTIERMQRRTGIVLFYFINMLFGVSFVLSGIYHFPIYVIIFLGFLTEMMVFIDGPFLHTYEIEIYPTYLRSTAGGISYSYDRLGGFVAPLLGAYLIVLLALRGYIIVFVIGAIMWGLCSLVGYLLTIKTTGVTLENLEA